MKIYNSSTSIFCFVFNQNKFFAEKSGGGGAELHNDAPASSKSLKAKTTKAERRALQESQRAAKAAAKGLI